jgi:hypothetical protein
MLRHAVRTAALATAAVAVVTAAVVTVRAASGRNSSSSSSSTRSAGLMTSVPEPASLAVLAIGGALVMCRRRR